MASLSLTGQLQKANASQSQGQMRSWNWLKRQDQAKAQPAITPFHNRHVKWHWLHIAVRQSTADAMRLHCENRFVSPCYFAIRYCKVTHEGTARTMYNSNALVFIISVQQLFITAVNWQRILRSWPRKKYVLAFKRRTRQGAAKERPVRDLATHARDAIEMHGVYLSESK